MKIGPRLELSIEEHQGIRIVRFAGVVDEFSPLATCLSGETGQKILIDAEKISRINSFGVRHWINWLRALAGTGNEVYLFKLQDALVAHVRTVKDFLGPNGKVVSFYAPFFCDACGDQSAQLLTASPELLTGKVSLDRPCEGCRRTLRLDGDAEADFDFLEGNLPASVPQQWLQWLGERSAR